MAKRTIIQTVLGFIDDVASDPLSAVEQLGESAVHAGSRIKNGIYNGASGIASRARMQKRVKTTCDGGKAAREELSGKTRAARDNLSGAREALRGEIAAIRARDPAARSDAEVLLLYSGLHAVLSHRLAHKLLDDGHPFAARAVSQTARHLTGIEIHPGATIGKGLFIDHGAGVVIGETAVIGDNCTIYQGVTLGGTGKHVGKRHPTLGDNVMVGAGAKVLGPFKIGDNAKIAAGAVVLEEVPPDSTAVGIPAHVVRRGGDRVDCSDLDQVHIPDPVAQELCQLKMRLARLEAEIDARESDKNK